MNNVLMDVPVNSVHRRIDVTRPEHTVGAWMRRPAIAIPVDAPLSEALAVMHECSIRRLPVVADNGSICGIITDGDIRGTDVLRVTGMHMPEIAMTLRQTLVYDVMTTEPITVMPHMLLREAALLMLDNKIGGLPVVNANDDVIGIITESDLFEALVCHLDHDASINQDVRRL